MVKKIILLIIFLLPLSLFGEYLEGDDGDWVWVGSVTNAETGKLYSELDNSSGNFNVTNKSFAYFAFNFGYRTPIFNGDYKSRCVDVDLFHISKERKLHQISFSWYFDFQLDSLRHLPLNSSPSENRLLLSGWEISYLHGYPLWRKDGGRYFFLFSLDMGAFASFFSSRDQLLKLEDSFFLEPRFGVRITAPVFKVKNGINALISVYLHAACQYQNFHGSIVNPDSATPNLSLYDLNYNEVKPGLILGWVLQIYWIKFSGEWNLLVPKSSRLEIGLSFIL